MIIYEKFQKFIFKINKFNLLLFLYLFISKYLILMKIK